MRLSDREEQSLMCKAKGMSAKQAAVHLDISEGTVKSYLQLARLKLGAYTTEQAIYIYFGQMPVTTA